MRIHTLLLLIPLGACAGGPLTTDKELAWTDNANSARDQAYAYEAAVAVSSGLEIPAPVAAPDPATKPQDGFDWAAALNLLLWGAGGGGLLSLLRRIPKRDPLVALADFVTRRKHPPAPPPTAA